MSLRLAVLSLLEAKSMTGYELTKAFDLSVVNLWHASHSQIYPELQKLERAGLVAAQKVARGQRAVKTRYEITPLGCDTLREWVETVIPPERQRDAALLKATYLEWASYAQARRQFEAHLFEYQQLRDKWLSHVEDLKNQDTELMRRRLEGRDEQAAAAITAYKVHAIEGLISRAQSEIAWATRGIDLVDELCREGHAEPGHRPAAPTPPHDASGGSAEVAPASLGG